MAIDLKDIKVGDRVYYRPSHFPKDRYERGIVSKIGRSRDCVFVVYHCNGEWDNYQNYTGQLTDLRSLYPGWDPEEVEIKNFLNKYSK